MQRLARLGGLVLPAPAGSAGRGPRRQLLPRVLPATAGVSRRRTGRNPLNPALPLNPSPRRTRGGQPEEALKFASIGMSSPHPRGQPAVGAGVIIACRSSPHPQGSADEHVLRHGPQHVLPAPAGVSRGPLANAGVLPPPPRTRRGQPHVDGDGGTAADSSPHSRGSAAGIPAGSDTAEILPALVGVSRTRIVSPSRASGRRKYPDRPVTARPSLCLPAPTLGRWSAALAKVEGDIGGCLAGQEHERLQQPLPERVGALGLRLGQPANGRLLPGQR